MGCSGSTEQALQCEHLEELTVVHLNDEQKELIKESWRKIQLDATKAGVIMFVRLFENLPECKNAIFNFRNVEDPRVQASRELRAHGLRVMSFLEKSMARLDKPERLEQLVLELGRKHFHYHSNPKYYMYLGIEFISVIKPTLKEIWTSELEEAWKTLFLYLTQIMRLGFEEEQGKQCHSVARPMLAQTAGKNLE